MQCCAVQYSSEMDQVQYLSWNAQKSSQLSLEIVLLIHVELYPPNEIVYFVKFDQNVYW